MIRTQERISKNLRAEITSCKTSLEQLQGRYDAAIERMRAQDGQIRDHRVEIEHLQKLVAELEPAVSTLRRYDLVLKTCRMAMRTVHQLLMDSGYHTEMEDLFDRCERRIIAVDASKGIYHPQAPYEPQTVAGYVDDMASEASGPSEQEVADGNDYIDIGHSVNIDDEYEDFDHLADDVDEHGNIRGLIDDEEVKGDATPRGTKRKQARIAHIKPEADRNSTPRTPTRARVPSTFGRGAQPFTPPSSVRKIKTPSSFARQRLPRKAKKPADGSGFYHISHTGSHLKWE